MATNTIREFLIVTVYGSFLITLFLFSTMYHLTYICEIAYSCNIFSSKIRSKILILMYFLKQKFLKTLEFGVNGCLRLIDLEYIYLLLDAIRHGYCFVIMDL